jgi:hypothetical protein
VHIKRQAGLLVQAAALADMLLLVICQAGEAEYAWIRTQLRKFAARNDACYTKAAAAAAVGAAAFLCRSLIVLTGVAAGNFNIQQS